MALTDLQARKAGPRDKAYKLADALGLYLFVSSTGFKSWRMKYRFADAEKRLSFGPYPEVTLAEAREHRDRARKLLRDFRDPATEKRKRKMAAHASVGATFESVALKWHAAQRARWSPLQSKKVEQAFKRDVLPEIGKLPIKDVDGPTILAMLRKVEARGSIDTAKRIRQHVSAVFGYAMAEGRVGVDPAAGVGRALQPIGKKGKQPALRTLDAAKQLLLDMDKSTAGPLTKLASRLLALTLVRPGVVRAARWSEFEEIDWSKPGQLSPDALWRVPAERMKLDLEGKGDGAMDHVIPLPRQAVELLHAVRRLTGTIDYLFPSIRSTRQPMSENTIGYMYARNGYSGRHVPHGWRATFSTLMNERAVTERRVDDRAVVDAMLAHSPTGVSASEMAYNRAVYMPRRKEIAAEWADMIANHLVPAAALLNAQAR